MVGIHERNALAVLVERGFTTADAIAMIGQIKPLATYEGQRFFETDVIYAAKREA